MSDGITDTAREHEELAVKQEVIEEQAMAVKKEEAMLGQAEECQDILAADDLYLSVEDILVIMKEVDVMVNSMLDPVVKMGTELSDRSMMEKLMATPCVNIPDLIQNVSGLQAIQKHLMGYASYYLKIRLQAVAVPKIVTPGGDDKIITL
jgi:hypothetical protein